MRTALASLALAAAACGPSSTPAPSIGNTSGGAAAPAGPAPTIAWDAAAGGGVGGFTTTGLPAVSADGELVAIAYEGEDGARAHANLALQIKDRADAITHEQVVLRAADEWAPPAPAALDDANATLARTHADRGWTPIPAAEVEANADSVLSATSWTARAGDVAIQFDVTGLVSVQVAGATAVERDQPGWLVPDAPMCAGCPETCSNPPRLDAAWIAPEHGLAILRIAYLGTDTCWEPDGAPHVLTW